jgi:hypothetical protein
MAVFVSASDETSGATSQGIFHYCGYVAPLNDWSEFFAPAWYERVLAGPPAIPYLHMTDIRSKGWRQQHGLSEVDADLRVQAACEVIGQLGGMFPARATLPAGDFRVSCGKRKMRVSSKAIKTFEPDYLGFMGYAFLVLRYIADEFPDADKVDFIIERKKGISEHIVDFHNDFPEGLASVGQSSLAPLLGELIPGGKERIPLQAADVLCWHTQRAELRTASKVDLQRLRTITRASGHSFTWSKAELIKLNDGFERRLSEMAK